VGDDNRGDDGLLTSCLRTAFTVLLPPALVATLWLIGWLHANGERTVTFPPLKPQLAHAAPGDASNPPDDSREARAEVGEALDP
jgi:hypothetical protein